MTALTDVLAERIRQDVKWGEQNQDPTVWLAILTEEVGEVAKEIADGRAPCSPTSAGGINLGQYREELVQVAAVAVAAIECLDRDVWVSP